MRELDTTIKKFTCAPQISDLKAVRSELCPHTLDCTESFVKQREDWTVVLAGKTPILLTTYKTYPGKQDEQQMNAHLIHEMHKMTTALQTFTDNIVEREKQNLAHVPATKHECACSIPYTILGVFASFVL